MTRTLLGKFSRCRSCRAPMFWRTTQGGKSMPLDVEPVANGNLVLVGDDEVELTDLFTPPNAKRYVSHFATCPDADEYRKGRTPWGTNA